MIKSWQHVYRTALMNFTIGSAGLPKQMVFFVNY